MTTSLFSPSWYRVAKLRPRLRKHVDIHRHDYKGRIWFILEDHANGRSHRLSPAAYRILGFMNGQRTVQELWALANEQLADRAPTQDETIRLLGQLHAADAMVCDVPPDSRELFRRFQKHERQKIKQRFWSPLAVRIPIWDPDAFLTRTYPYVSWLFTRTGFVLWALLVLVGTVFAIVYFSQITENIFDRALTVENLLVLWLVYPVVKAFHELGHGYAVKANGGEVHEIGIMLLVLIPVPYVDASAASAFRDKYQRMLVGGVGIMVELALASLALFVWLNVAPGPTHVVAYNVMLIGGISTLLFNGNPLLRFDGYYVLADWIEIPNLGTRSNNHIFYVIQKYLFRARDAEPVTSLAYERRWFVFYGLAAFAYRMFIMVAIILYMAGRFFAVGVILAIWAATTQAIVPLAKGVHFLIDSPKLRGKRGRAIATTLAVLGLLAALLFVVPFPSRTIADGVAWPAVQSQVRAEVDGFVREIRVKNGDLVAVGDVVVVAEDPFLEARRRVILSRIETLVAQEAMTRRQDRVEAAVLKEEIAAAEAQLERIDKQLESMVIRADRSGRIVIPMVADLRNVFVRRGAVVGYVIDPEDLRTLRVMIEQDRVGLVRARTRAIEAWPSGFDREPVGARIVRETPGGVMELPTAALGVQGGGSIPVDPRDAGGTRTLQRYFEFEVLLDETDPGAFLGRRSTVKFDHGFEPVGFQIARNMRQLFLRLYGV